MEGNVVKAAWILGGSILVGVVIFGVGAIACVVWFSKVSSDQAERISERAAQAVLEAPKNARVAFVQDSPIRAVVALDTSVPFKVGFENKLPMALRLENSLDESKGTRAPLVLKLNP